MEKTKEQIIDLITWLSNRRFPTPHSLPRQKFIWRMGYNKAINDIIALLKYTGEYKDNTEEIIKRYTKETDMFES